MSLRADLLKTAAELPVGAPTRRKLLALLKKDAGKVGPYIRFNNKLWVIDWGSPVDPKEGTWKRVRLVNPKTGLPRKTELEIHWKGRGELSAYMSHRKQITYKYEDVGYYEPPVAPKEARAIVKDYKNLLPLAKEIVLAADKDADSAIGFASDVLEDVNWHSLSGNVGGRNAVTTMRAQDIGSKLGWDVYAAASLAWYVAGLVKNSGVKKVVEDALLGEIKRDKAEELKEALRRI